MWTIILVLIVFVGGYFAYIKIIMPKMNEKADERQKTVKGDVISQLSGREDEVRDAYLKTHGSVSLIANQMNEDTIEGIISCMERRNLKDVTRQALKNVAGKAVGQLVGIGFKQTDNDENYYLAFSPERLHYLHFSTEGECREHLLFDRNRLENPETGKVTSSEATTLAADMFETTRLSFTYEGETYKFFYFEKFYNFVSDDDDDDDDKVSDKEFAELNYLFAEPFLKFAASIRQES